MRAAGRKLAFDSLSRSFENQPPWASLGWRPTPHARWSLAAGGSPCP